MKTVCCHARVLQGGKRNCTRNQELNLSMRVCLIGINARYTHSCLALFYIRDVLMSHCPDIGITLEQYSINDPYYELLLRLSAMRPEYYFFSALIWNSELVSRLVDDLAMICPDSVCVIGGPQAQVVAASVSRNDIVEVRGEIERVDKTFFSDLQNGSMAALYQCRQQGGEFPLPYTESDMSGALRHRHIYYESSRGCPFSCSYCLSASDTEVRHKDVDTVRCDMEKILAHNPREVRFVDRTFNDNGRRALAIWEFLAVQGGDSRFHFEISPVGFSEEMFSLLAGLPPGRFEFEIGVQSTNPETLQAIGRPVRGGQAGEIVRRLAGLGTVYLHVDLILGLPCETEETFLQSFRDVFAMGAHYIQMGVLKILPNTPIQGQVAEHGILYCRQPPYTVLANKWLSAGSLQHLYWFGECVERFVNNRYFVSIWSYLRKQDEDVAAFFLRLQVACERLDYFRQSPTQESLTELLLQVSSKREDNNLFFELLRYDWLRCGHKFLPQCLAGEDAPFKECKREVFSRLTPDTEPRSTEVRTACFKKGLFVWFSSAALKEVGFCSSGDGGFICFLPEREDSLFGHCRTLLFTV